MVLTLAFLLIAMGVLLLAAKLLYPSLLLTVAALPLLAIGVVMVFNQNPTIGVVTLLVLLVTLPLLLNLVVHYFPRTPVGRRLVLDSPEAEGTLASTPVNQELGQLIGQVGCTVSDLRPSGITNFDGRRIDTITEGMMVDAGQMVRCVGVQAGKVIVRPVDKPDPGLFTTMDFG
jgi:membrane-bound ClpP family serine protease